MAVEIEERGSLFLSVFQRIDLPCKLLRKTSLTFRSLVNVYLTFALSYVILTKLKKRKNTKTRNKSQFPISCLLALSSVHQMSQFILKMQRFACNYKNSLDFCDRRQYIIYVVTVTTEEFTTS